MGSLSTGAGCAFTLFPRVSHHTVVLLVSTHGVLLPPRGIVGGTVFIGPDEQGEVNHQMIRC